MGYPESTYGGHAIFGPHGKEPHESYSRRIHTRLRQLGYSTKRTPNGIAPPNLQYMFTTEQLPAVTSIIKEVLDNAPPIKARPGKRTSFQIFVRTVSGNNITLNVAASDTIADVKAKIAEKEGEDVERLIFGTQLEAQRTLSDYGITRNSTIFELPRGLGGAREAPTTEDNIESIETHSNQLIED